MMRIAIAGSGGLASCIAIYIQQETPHQVLILSRTNPPEYQARDIAVQVVDYENAESLKFALSGIDIVVSTILGDAQLYLIQAAVRARVPRFIPAEFEGRPELTSANDPLDRGRHRARQFLRQYQDYIQSMVVICGIFYERFQPGGLAAAKIGFGSGFSEEGNYMLDIRHMTAQVPMYNSHNQPSEICMTSVRDVARYVVRALELEQWPSELRIAGERMSVYDLMTLVSGLRDQEFNPIDWYLSQEDLASELSHAIASRDFRRIRRAQMLIATAQGRYVFTNANMRSYFPDIQPIRFRDWLTRVWNLEDDD